MSGIYSSQIGRYYYEETPIKIYIKEEAKDPVTLSFYKEFISR